MKISYEIKEQDYLTHQLYTASASKLVKRKRLTFWLIVPISYGILAYLSYFNFKQLNMAYVMGGLALFWLCTYPFYSRWNYKRHYKKHINENLKRQFDQVVNLELRDQHLTITDTKNNSSNITFNSLKEVVELPEHFLVRLESNSSIILPKREFADIKELQKFLGLIVTKHKVPFRKDIKWKWR